jgi:hypothetical protein
LWIITFITSIPARFFLYAPVLDHEGKEQMASELPLLVPLAGLEPATSCLGDVSVRRCAGARSPWSSASVE